MVGRTLTKMGHGAQKDLCDEFESLHHLCNAEVLVMARSNFSLMAAFLGSLGQTVPVKSVPLVPAEPAEVAQAVSRL